jgi:hypothetical protein
MFLYCPNFVRQLHTDHGSLIWSLSGGIFVQKINLVSVVYKKNKKIINNQIGEQIKDLNVIFTLTQSLFNFMN